MRRSRLAIRFRQAPRQRFEYLERVDARSIRLQEAARMLRARIQRRGHCETMQTERWRLASIESRLRRKQPTVSEFARSFLLLLFAEGSVVGAKLPQLGIGVLRY